MTFRQVGQWVSDCGRFDIVKVSDKYEAIDRYSTGPAVKFPSLDDAMNWCESRQIKTLQILDLQLADEQLRAKEVGRDGV